MLLIGAFVWMPSSGGKPSPAPSGQPVVVTLVSLDSMEAGREGPTRSDEIEPESATQPAPTLPQRPSGPRDAAQDAALTPSVDPAPAGEGAYSAPQGADIQTYQHALLVHIERYRRYPEAARRERLEGVVILRFRMDRQGNVLDAWVDRSSGLTILDAEAVAAVRRAQPLPMIPASLPDRLGIAMPIAFSLQ